MARPPQPSVRGDQRESVTCALSCNSSRSSRSGPAEPRSSPRPCCLVPKNSPTPRNFASSSARAKPSVVRVSVRRRSARLVVDLLGEQVTLPRDTAAADPPPQLVELRQAEAVGVLDHHQRRVGHVHADLDHHRADQQVQLAAAEIAPSRRPSPSSSSRPCSRPDAGIRVERLLVAARRHVRSAGLAGRPSPASPSFPTSGQTT